MIFRNEWFPKSRLPLQGRTFLECSEFSVTVEPRGLEGQPWPTRTLPGLPHQHCPWFCWHTSRGSRLLPEHLRCSCGQRLRGRGWAFHGYPSAGRLLHSGWPPGHRCPTSCTQCWQTHTRGLSSLSAVTPVNILSGELYKHVESWKDIEFNGW